MRTRLLALLALGALGGCDDPGAPPESSAGGAETAPGVGETAAAEPWFREVAETAGIAFRHVSGARGEFEFPEIMGGGAALLDFDGDGRLDVYLAQSGRLEEGGAPDTLLQNQGSLRFADVSRAAGIDRPGYSMGCGVGDHDGDGDADLFVANVGANLFYDNLGDGRFADATERTGLGSEGWSTSSAFLDHDRDGDLDLAVVDYVLWTPETERACRSSAGARIYCSPNSYGAPAPDALWENRGDGTFEDVSVASGIGLEPGNGLGIACGDFDRDGWVDLYVANDGMANRLWRNGGDGTFVDEAVRRMCAFNASGQAEAGMGVQTLDFDGDGDLDVFLTHLRHETNTFYRNAGEWFEDATAPLGLGSPSYAYTGFGLGFHDFDHDGELDLYVANGRVVRWEPSLADDVYAEPNQLFRGDGSGFAQMLPSGGTRTELVHTSRAAAFGDLDDDGDVDIVVANRDAAPYLLENVAPKRGAWALFDVVAGSAGSTDSTASSGSALYAELSIAAGGRSLRRRVERAYGYGSASDARVHVGLGDAQRVDEVVVRWPDGSTERFGPFEANRVLRLVRGEGEATEEK